jgi:hypothetical protein
MADSNDRLTNVKFEHQISNPMFIKPLRMNFERVSRKFLRVLNSLISARSETAMGDGV